MSESAFCIQSLDHVQVAMPPGEEAAARAFYTGILGLEEIPKPDSLAARGGAWFRGGSMELHLGVEQDFRPARKAHPAFRVKNLPALEQHVIAAGLSPVPDAPIGGRSRFFLHDPFGNRLEFLELL